MDPLANKFQAWREFFNIAQQRITSARRRVTAPGVNAGPLDGKNPGIVLGAIEFSENLFANESQFTVPFRLIGARFDQVMQLSGMWRPIIGVGPGQTIPANGDALLPQMAYPWSAQTWTASLQGPTITGGTLNPGGAQKAKGYLGASFDPSFDVLIDVCSGDLPAAAGVGIAPIVAMSPDEAIAGAQGGDIDQGLAADNPAWLASSISVAGAYDENLDDNFTPECSWLAYECIPTRLVDHNQIRHKPLAGTVAYQTPAVDPLGPALPMMQDTTVPSFGFTADTPDIIQQTAAPSIWIRLKGHAVRVAWRANAPKLVSFGGQPAILKQEEISEDPIGFQGAVLYRTRWNLVYMISGPSSSIPLPANPTLGLDGSVADAGLSMATTPPGGLLMAH